MIIKSLWLYASLIFSIQIIDAMTLEQEAQNNRHRQNAQLVQLKHIVIDEEQNEKINNHCLTQFLRKLVRCSQNLFSKKASTKNYSFGESHV